jgi:hypothetical protein
MRKIKYWLAKKIIKHVFLSITEDDVLALHGNKLYRGPFQLTQQDASAIIQGARAMEQMDVWNALLTDTRFVLYKNMFDKAHLHEDLYFARGGLYALEILEKKIRNLANLR